MTKTTQYGYIEDGKLHVLNDRRFKDDLRQFKNMDVEIIVKKRGKRSLPQNAFYWGCVIDEIRRELKRRGEDFLPEEIHEGLKAKFNPKGIANKETGEEVFAAGGSTTEMNKEEFGEYLDRVIKWCADSLEITIPEPSTQTTMFNDQAA